MTTNDAPCPWQCRWLGHRFRWTWRDGPESERPPLWRCTRCGLHKALALIHYRASKKPVPPAPATDWVAPLEVPSRIVVGDTYPCTRVAFNGAAWTYWEGGGAPGGERPLPIRDGLVEVVRPGQVLDA